jgi:protein SCO1
VTATRSHMCADDHTVCWLRSAVLAAGVLLACAAFGGAAHDDAGAPPAQASGPARRAMTSTAGYTVPPVRLVRDDGKSVSLPEEMNDGRPVVLNFIFTTCSSICPLMSQVFSQFERQLGSERDRVHLMSISVDPEEDTPARLREYAQKFHAGPEWQHYTGTQEASLAAQRAFNVFRGEKMNHSPVTFLRLAPGDPWQRIDGFVTPNELLAQYRRLLQQSAPSVATR